MSNRMDRALRRAAEEIADLTGAGDDAKQMIFRLVKAEYLKGSHHRKGHGGLRAAKETVQKKIQDAVAGLEEDQQRMVGG